MTAQTARAAMTSTVPGDRRVEADLALVEPEAVLAEVEIFFGRCDEFPGCNWSYRA